MCGIAGCYQQADGQKLVEIMTDRIAHRGPDAAGIWITTTTACAVQLGHRRLSIIDLSTAADQPLSKDGLTLVYNGELYNYQELRAELVARGVRFTTESDTEVVLEAWRSGDRRRLRRFRGMFAFALLDERTGELVLARDPLGIKPLYYLPRGEGVVFASELKALVAAVGPELRIGARRPGGVDALLLGARAAVRHRRRAEASRRVVGELPPRRHAPRSGRYWRVADVAAEAAAGPPADLRPVIEESVAAHLVSDVPVSSFLSGGLDSSIVTVLAHQANPGIDAYTITFRPEDQRLEAMPDDAVYARKVAARYGIKLHEIEISPDIVDLLPRIVDVLDEPIGDPAAINTLLMCEAARERGVKVILSGMGADELFGGYRKHLACVMASQYRRLPAAPRAVVRSAVDRLPVSAAGRGLRYAAMGEAVPDVRRAGRGAAVPPQLHALRPGRAGRPPQPRPRRLCRPGHRASTATSIDDNSLPDEVNRMCLADTRLFLPGLNLAYTDRASMAASVEVRVPFVDPVVAQAAFSIGGAAKIRRRQGKVALKQAAESWLPREIVYRPKASFSAPLRAWVRNDLQEVIRDVLVEGELADRG